MLLSDFFQKKRKQRIEAAKAEGIAQGKAEAEAKILNEFADRIEAAQGNTMAEAKILNEFADRLENAQSNTKAEAKTLSILAEQIEIAKAKREEDFAKGQEEGFAKGREEGFAEGKIEGAAEVYDNIAEWNRHRKEAEERGEILPDESDNKFQINTQWGDRRLQKPKVSKDFSFGS